MKNLKSRNKSLLRALSLLIFLSWLITGVAPTTAINTPVPVLAVESCEADDLSLTVIPGTNILKPYPSIESLDLSISILNHGERACEATLQLSLGPGLFFRDSDSADCGSKPSPNILACKLTIEQKPLVRVAKIAVTDNSRVEGEVLVIGRLLVTGGEEGARDEASIRIVGESTELLEGDCGFTIPVERRIVRLPTFPDLWITGLTSRCGYWTRIHGIIENSDHLSQIELEQQLWTLAVTSAHPENSSAVKPLDVRVDHQSLDLNSNDRTFELTFRMIPDDRRKMRITIDNSGARQTAISILPKTRWENYQETGERVTSTLEKSSVLLSTISLTALILLAAITLLYRGGERHAAATPSKPKLFGLIWITFTHTPWILAAFITNWAYVIVFDRYVETRLEGVELFSLIGLIAPVIVGVVFWMRVAKIKRERTILYSWWWRPEYVLGYRFRIAGGNFRHSDKLEVTLWFFVWILTLLGTTVALVSITG